MYKVILFFMLSREDIRNIVIKINDEDIKGKLKNLETQLTNAKKQKELLEKKVSSDKRLSVK